MITEDGENVGKFYVAKEITGITLIVCIWLT